MPPVKLWRRDMVEAVRYLLDGSNLADVTALADDVPWHVDGDGVLWVWDMLGDVLAGVPMQRVPRGWWLIRGPWPQQLTPFPPLLLLTRYAAAPAVDPEPAADVARASEEPRPGRRLGRLLKKHPDMVTDDEHRLAALGDELGRKADLDDLKRVFDQKELDG